MNEVMIVVPTRNRLKKLIRMINSVPDKPEFKLLIICDGDQTTYDAIENIERENPMDIWLMRGQNGSVACRNAAARVCTDGYLYAVDDIEFNPSSIERAMRTFNEQFPDDDGVVGFHQEGQRTYHPTGVALVGQKFLQRYPEKQLFYPKYFHFSCQEVHELALKVDRFCLDKSAMLYHHHPQHGGEMDATHTEARKYKAQDFKIRRERRANKIIWGDQNGKTNGTLVDRTIDTLRRKVITKGHGSV